MQGCLVPYEDDAEGIIADENLDVMGNKSSNTELPSGYAYLSNIVKSLKAEGKSIEVINGNKNVTISMLGHTIGKVTFKIGSRQPNKAMLINGNMAINVYDFMRNFYPKTYKSNAPKWPLKDKEVIDIKPSSNNKWSRWVFDVQKKLNALKYVGTDGKPLNENGMCGDKETLKAVNNFKRIKGLINAKNYGVIDKQTWNALFFQKTNLPSHMDNSEKIISPVWRASDKGYSDMVQAKLLALNFEWYFADSIDEQNKIVQRANYIREKVNSGAGWWVDNAKQVTEAAANEFSWFLGGSVSTNERDELLKMNQMFQSDMEIKDDKTLATGMFIAGIFTGGGEEKFAAKTVKSWIKHDTYNEVRDTLGKEGVERFIKAMKKGIVGSVGEIGIKPVKGMVVGGKSYEYEIKLIAKGMSHYRILGNYDKKSGHIIFDLFKNMK